MLLLLHFGATAFMCGVIWVIQLVHYPLFSHVGEAGYAAYQKYHMRWITPVVVPPMLLELITALWLVVSPMEGIPGWAAWLGLALVVFLWGSTGLVQAPTHGRLAAGFDARLHRKLVVTNWLRTGGWTVRTGLAGWMHLQGV